MPPLLQACLNGGRTDAEHPAIPRSPEDLANETAAAVEAGAQVVHLHPCDGNGSNTFGAAETAAALRAVRKACLGIPISLSTSADIEPDPARRLASIEGWTEVPDLVTANQGEEGIVELCRQLVGRGVGIEAGLLEPADAQAFVASGLANSCVRVLMEPLVADPTEAIEQAAEMERVVIAAGIDLEQVHHGDGVATWSVMQRALARGHGTRAGLEDTTVLPDGTPTAGNAELVATAAVLIARI